jgi:hypothetical protein
MKPDLSRPSIILDKPFMSEAKSNDQHIERNIPIPRQIDPINIPFAPGLGSVD